MERALELLAGLDGTVDAIGLGGIDLYLYAGGRRYEIEDAKKLRAAVRQTPVVDGSGLKDSLEREAVRFLQEEGFELSGKHVLLASAVDRFGLAEELERAGCVMTYGDLLFMLNIPKGMYDLETVGKLAEELLPKMVTKPFHMIYPVGEAQDRDPDPKYAEFYNDADIVAGDWHLIHKHMPARLDGKWILTNTTTPDDVETLRKRHAEYLITTTPEIGGRSFGTNVMEAALIAVMDKPWRDVTSEDYLELVRELGLRPRIEKLN